MEPLKRRNCLCTQVGFFGRSKFPPRADLLFRADGLNDRGNFHLPPGKIRRKREVEAAVGIWFQNGGDGAHGGRC